MDNKETAESKPLFVRNPKQRERFSARSVKISNTLAFSLSSLALAR
jgi:hypothetical protein